LNIVTPIVKEMMVQINAHRTNAGTRPAQRRSIRKVFEFVSPQVRRKYATDRTAVNRSVGMTTNVPAHRTNVQARAAADAVQHLSLFRVGQQTAAAVIDQYNMKFFRPIGLASSSWSTDQSSVSRDRLPST